MLHKSLIKLEGQAWISPPNTKYTRATSGASSPQSEPKKKRTKTNNK